MAIRKEVDQLVSLGPLPSSDFVLEANLDQSLDQWGAALRAIPAPVSNEEAAILTELFGPDECFGVAWSLLHLIETAPRLPRLRPELLLRSPFVRTVVSPRWTRR